MGRGAKWNSLNKISEKNNLGGKNSVYKLNNINNWGDRLMGN